MSVLCLIIKLINITLTNYFFNLLSGLDQRGGAQRVHLLPGLLPGRDAEVAGG